MTDRIKFDRARAPYEAGDVAGFPESLAQDFVDAGVAIFWPPAAAAPADTVADSPADILDDMDRAALIGFAKEHLRLTDEPPAETADDDLRAVIRAGVDPALLAPVTETGAAAGKKAAKKGR